MSWTAPKTWAVGDTLTSPDMNQYNRDNIAFLGTPPSVSCYNSGNLAVANSAFVLATFDTNRYDLLPSGYTGPQHSTSVNPSRLICVVAGKYNVFAFTSYTSGIAGEVINEIRLNGVSIICQQGGQSATGFGGPVNISRTWHFNAGDYIELLVFQNSGAASTLTASNATTGGTDFGWTWQSF